MCTLCALASCSTETSGSVQKETNDNAQEATVSNTENTNNTEQIATTESSEKTNSGTVQHSDSNIEPIAETTPANPQETKPLATAPEETIPPETKPVETQAPETDPPETQPTNQKTVYYTKSGIRYHYENPCGKGTYYPISLSEAEKKGLTPCEKCVLH